MYILIKFQFSKFNDRDDRMLKIVNWWGSFDIVRSISNLVDSSRCNFFFHAVSKSSLSSQFKRKYIVVSQSRLTLRTSSWNDSGAITKAPDFRASFIWLRYRPTPTQRSSYLHATYVATKSAVDDASGTECLRHGNQPRPERDRGAIKDRADCRYFGGVIYASMYRQYVSYIYRLCARKVMQVKNMRRRNSSVLSRAKKW